MAEHGPPGERLIDGAEAILAWQRGERELLARRVRGPAGAGERGAGTPPLAAEELAAIDERLDRLDGDETGAELERLVERDVPRLFAEIGRLQAALAWERAARRWEAGQVGPGKLVPFEACERELQRDHLRRARAELALPAS